MKIIKRNGRHVNFNPNNITKRIKDQSQGLEVNADEVAIKVISQIIDGITTVELDVFAMEVCASSICKHPDYNILASRLFVTALHKSTPTTFSEAMSKLDDLSNIMSEEFISFVMNHTVELNEMIVQDRDFNHDFFGLKTLERSYLLKTSKKFGNKIVERPQYMWLRVALFVSDYDLIKTKQTYDLLSQKFYTHATPTLFNSATKKPQLSSCFLIANEDDSIEGLFNTLKDVARISKWAGGIGLHIHNVRSKGSYIEGTGGMSDGIVPMLKTYNDTARWINQGGKRKGSFAIYLEPWHADVYDFLELKKNHGAEEMRARDLFYAMWIPDLFMERVEQNGKWTLFDPKAVREYLKEAGGFGLDDVYGDEFNETYRMLENSGVGNKTVDARDLWEKIMISQIETGMPYMLYKDAANRSSNQSNIDIIRSSNLCTEILEVSNKEHQAVCNLASIGLPMFVEDGVFNYELLGTVTQHIVQRLDTVIDVNYYPTIQTKTSNFDTRPMGIGVQGLADVFAKLRLAFDSEEARMMNAKIFECIYFNAVSASIDLAKQKGVYPMYQGSPASQGKFHFDMKQGQIPFSGDFDWDALRVELKQHGLRNSLLIAPMPTASTSQILGNNEAFEPYTSNMYTRRTLAGEYIVTNNHLIKELFELGLWDKDIESEFKTHNGSIQSINFSINNPQGNEIVDSTGIRDRYKTAFEISQKVIINHASDRQYFVDQSQSMNLFVQNANIGKLTSMHFYGWKSDLKTGMYYLRTKSAVDAKKFTVAVKKQDVVACSIDNPDDCDMCGS